MTRYMVLLTLLWSLAACATEGVRSGPAGCSEDYNPLAVTPVAGAPELALYREICDGGLYLINSRSGAELIRVNAGWWIDEVAQAEALPDGAVLVDAKFITGVGPTGSVPFSQRYRLEKSASTWQVAQLPPDESAPVWLSPSLVEISNQAQLDAIALRGREGSIDMNVDLSQHRLLLYSLWLTSGSARVTEVSVQRNYRSYFVEHRTEAPAIGTTDMKHVVLYAVLPKDYRTVSFEGRELDAKRFRARAGALPHATFKGAPTP